MSVPEAFGHQGAYRVVSELGRGGFATVYKAYQASLERYVAVKLLRPDVIRGVQDIQRFQREARMAARLGGHPNIVTIYDYGEQDGQVYLVLEYIEGTTLEERLSLPISAAEVQRIISAVASALDYAHSQSLIHRDVKPSNVLLHKDSRVVLSDFGIVKTLDAVTNVSLTGAVLGTPEYMAPEQFEDNVEVDARTDIYAFGVLLYRVFAGRTPFQGSIISVANKHIHEAPPPIASLGHPIPPEVEAVVLKALAKQPADRYSSAGELAAVLGRALLPSIMIEQARSALDRGEVERAEQIANQLLVDHPRDAAARELRMEIDTARRGATVVAQVNSLLQEGDWRGAILALDQARLRESKDPRIAELAQWAESMRAAEQARLEAEVQRLEAERRQREREEWEQGERERQARVARERAERERQAREAMEQAERERQARAEAAETARLEAERQRAEAERLLREREEWEQAERERQEREAGDRTARERLARAAMEQAEQERLARSQAAEAAQREAEQRRAESESLLREREEWEQAERERQEAEARERVERERQAREAAEQALREHRALSEAADLARQRAEEHESTRPFADRPQADRQADDAGLTAVQWTPPASRPPEPPPRSEPRLPRIEEPVAAQDSSLTRLEPSIAAPRSQRSQAQATSLPAGPEPTTERRLDRKVLVGAAILVLLLGGALLFASGLFRGGSSQSATAGATAGPTGAPAAAPAAQPATIAPLVAPPATQQGAAATAPQSKPSTPQAAAGPPPAARAPPPAPLSTARYLATTTLLPNGMVLLAGGKQNSGGATTTSIYDPAKNSWVLSGSLATARSHHTATLLPSGKVLVVGGQDANGAYLDSAELYDPASSSWSPSGSLPTGRSDHTATALSNGKVLVAGGVSAAKFLDEAVLFDPASNSWSGSAPMASPHSGHTATVLPNGQVLVVGGFGTSTQATAEVYDPGSGTWSSAGSLADGRVEHTATLLPNGRVLAAGGVNSTAGGTYLATAELYDPGAYAWTKAASMASAHSGHSATLLQDGSVLIVAGKDGKGQVETAERYDPAANRWSAAGALTTARWLHSAALLASGQVLVVGGRGETEALAGTERYDPAANGWTAGESGPSMTIMMATQNNSGITGVATLTEIGGGKLKVDIRANGSGAGPQPAHIHEGTCAQLNPAPKFPLTPVSNGASSSEIGASLEQVTSTPHAIHMHKSPEEIPIYVACADLKAG